MTKEGFTELASKIPKIAIITGDADEIVRLSDCNLLHQMLPVSEAPPLYTRSDFVW